MPHAVVNPLSGNNSITNHDIYVSGHGWHTGIIIPSQEINASSPFLKNRFAKALYYEFGWGDKGFYQANKITTKLTVKAVFWPTDTVMHVVAVPEDPRKYFSSSEIVDLKISQVELESLLKFIDQSFGRSKSGDIIKLKKGLYGDSQFYEGAGKYFLFNTCNKWTAKGLKSAGVDISPTFKLSADSVMDFLRDRKATNKKPQP